MTALILVAGLCACAKDAALNGPELASALSTGLNRQVIRSDAPADRSGIDGLPGDLAAQIYEKRYIKTLTTEQTDDEETVSQELR